MTRQEAHEKRDALGAALAILRHASDHLSKEYSEIARALSDTVVRRINAGNPFGLDELKFSATARCDCGAGIAYPNDIGPGGFWDCAAILTGCANRTVKHCGQLPFAFYEIKSEDQPSAQGATTRPC